MHLPFWLLSAALKGAYHHQPLPLIPATPIPHGASCSGALCSRRLSTTESSKICNRLGVHKLKTLPGGCVVLKTGFLAPSRTVDTLFHCGDWWRWDLGLLVLHVPKQNSKVILERQNTKIQRQTFSALGGDDRIMWVCLFSIRCTLAGQLVFHL